MVIKNNSKRDKKYKYYENKNVINNGVKTFITSSWKEWKLGDILYGVVVPLIVALVIIAFPVYVRPALHAIDQSFTLESILVTGIEEGILLYGVPMLIGLIWNQWAGGASGFLLGSIYAISTFQMYGLSGDKNFFLLGYVLGAMLVGYMAGALNKGSFSFIRMLIAGLVTTIIGGLFVYLCMLIPGQPINMAAPDYAFSLFQVMTPRIIFGIVIPIIAKVFSWFGLTPRRMS